MSYKQVKFYSVIKIKENESSEKASLQQMIINTNFYYKNWHHWKTGKGHHLLSNIICFHKANNV